MCIVHKWVLSQQVTRQLFTVFSDRNGMAQNFREDNNLQPPQSKDWSEWFLAMVPDDNDNDGKNLKERGKDQEGYMNSDLRDALDAVGNECGIYEWRATRDGQPDRVVYVGSTCPREGSSPKLKNRIIGYCTNGNHKTTLINDALQKGYKLEVRYKLAENVGEARDMENELLVMYNYAWNIRLNGVRYILPQ